MFCIGGNGFVKGMIAFWSGSIATIPAGFGLCDGTQGTPDLRDKFLVGAGSTYAVADTGGEATHVLTTSEMPSHSHTVKIQGVGGSTSIINQGQSVAASQSYTSSTSGSGTAHENRPPYYALAYIMKL